MGFYFDCPYCNGNQHRPNVVIDEITECDYCHKSIKMMGKIPVVLTDQEKFNLPQLRMQALDIATRQANRTGFLAGETYILNLADLFVHYCLTGEHQLPEK